MLEAKLPVDRMTVQVNDKGAVKVTVWVAEDAGADLALLARIMQAGLVSVTLASPQMELPLREADAQGEALG